MMQGEIWQNYPPTLAIIGAHTLNATSLNWQSYTPDVKVVLIAT